MVTENRHAKRAQATRTRILDAACRELDEHGVEGFVVERVADRADVGLQSVYNHYRGRDGLLLAVAEHALAADSAYMEAAYDLTGPPEQRLLAAARAYVRFALDHPQQFRLLADPPRILDRQAGSDAAGTVAERTAQAVEVQNARLAQALRDGISDGTVNPGIDPEQAATAMWAMLNGLLSLGWRNDRHQLDRHQLQQLAEDGIALLAHGLRARL